jgi:hypothetical protein
VGGARRDQAAAGSATDARGAAAGFPVGEACWGRQLLARNRKSGEWPLLSLQLATACRLASSSARCLDGDEVAGRGRRCPYMWVPLVRNGYFGFFTSRFTLAQVSWRATSAKVAKM